MQSAPRSEPRPFEEVIIASTLESASGQQALMERIQQLSQERSQLQMRLAQQPWGAREAAARLREIATELETCWEEVRRSRAAQRARMEEAIGVDPAACQQKQRETAEPAARLTSKGQARRHRHLPLAYAS